MSAHSEKAAFEMDQATFAGRKAADDSTLLAYAAKESGRSVMDITLSFRKLAKSVGRVTLTEYIRYGLYRTDRHDAASAAAFIGDAHHWPLAHTCNDTTWNAAAEDKALANLILGSGGVAVAETLAVFDISLRSYPGVPKVATADALRDVILAHGGKDIFAKMLGGMVSFGALRVIQADADTVHCLGHEPMGWANLVHDVIGERPYLFQRELRNDPALTPYAGALATVRSVNMMGPDGVQAPYAAIKMPQGTNVADAFWRPGNLACAVDVATGRITSIARRGEFEIEYLDDHPENPGLMGFTLPHWDALRDMNARAAHLFAPIRYQSTDIALTPDGPVVVELNYGGGFDIIQNCHGKGMLDDTFRAFATDCGYDFNTGGRAQAEQDTGPKRSGWVKGLLKRNG